MRLRIAASIVLIMDITTQAKSETLTPKEMHDIHCTIPIDSELT
jgi:hypothetical protein